MCQLSVYSNTKLYQRIWLAYFVVVQYRSYLDVVQTQVS